MTDLTFFLAFGAGILSFISPCVFPLYPVFLSYITGMTVDEIKAGELKGRRKPILHTLFFLLGFSSIYIVLGFSTSALTGFFNQYSGLIRQLGAIMVIIFGFIALGVWKPALLMKNHKLNLKNRPPGYLGSIVIGIAFSAGWTPCMGPILGSVLALISTNPNQGMAYMIAYIAGFSVPFLLLAFFSVKLNWVKANSGRLMKIGGFIMVVVGTLLFFDQMTLFNRLLSPIFGDFQGF